MIDQDKMRALAKCLRADADFAGERESGSFDLRYEAADAIDLLLAEVEAANMQLTVPDWAEGDDQAWDKVTPAVAWHLIERHGENWAHIGRMMQAYLDAHTATLRAELEAAAADKRDQFARLLTIIEKDSEWADARAVDWTRGVLMATLKVALAQRQGEGS
ncbi:hypothetical protein KTE50_17660 [Burkholderia multivorans]|uniref:hypothetical protein n=1 Tax=Burkholderia multivorans TaxID=87883 RepID=UPI001C272628|nr:hypothetical protein [Burkholderia multivorans]MBU9550370.1 hypothetical protein [Burkholderia multivorans]